MRDAFDELDAELCGEEPDYETEPVAPLGAEDADRHLRRLARLKREANDVTQLANAEREKVDIWEADRLARINSKREWVQRSLEAYHRAVLSRDPKAKTISLPNGSLKARAQQPEWTFDEAVFIDWALFNAPKGVLRLKPPPAPEVDRAYAKKVLFVHPDGRVLIDGEVVRGVSVNEREPKFTAVPE